MALTLRPRVKWASTHFLSPEIDPDPSAITPYREARGRGNVLNYLPRELRNGVYGYVCADQPYTPIWFDDVDGRHICNLAHICEQIAEEVEPFIKKAKIVLENAADVKEAIKWLNTCTSSDGLKAVTTVVFSSFDLLRTVSAKEARLWLQDRDLEYSTSYWSSERAQSWMQRYPDAQQVKEFEPEGTQFLNLCPSVQHVELGIRLEHFAKSFDLLAGRMVHLLPCATVLYDFDAIFSISGLRSLTLHLDYGTVEEISTDSLSRVYGRGIRGDNLYRLPTGGMKDAWGLKGWLEYRFQKRGMEVKVSCRFHKDLLYPRPE